MGDKDENKQTQKPAQDAPNAPAPGQGQDPAPSSAETENTEPRGDHMIPKSRFDEVNERMKAAEAKLTEFQTSQEEAERKRKEKQGEFEALYQDTDAKLKATLEEKEAQASELTRYREAFDGMLKRRLEAAPDYIKALLEKMNALEAMQWLDENADKLAPVKPAAPNTNAGDGQRKPPKAEAKLRVSPRL